MRLGIALKAFFAALGNRDQAERIRRLLSGQDMDSARPDVKSPADASPAYGSPADAAARPPQAPVHPRPSVKPPAAAEPTGQNSAITLLTTLQRESRLIDLIQEDLSKYSDAQVGAAARPCLLQCAQVLQRVLDIKPLLDAEEGVSVSVPMDATPTRYQWIGEGGAAIGSSPNTNSVAGKLIHHGWQAGKVDLPIWTGDQRDAMIVAAAQIQST